MVDVTSGGIPLANVHATVCEHLHQLVDEAIIQSLPTLFEKRDLVTAKVFGFLQYQNDQPGMDLDPGMWPHDHFGNQRPF